MEKQNYALAISSSGEYYDREEYFSVFGTNASTGFKETYDQSRGGLIFLVAPFQAIDRLLGISELHGSRYLNIRNNINHVKIRDSILLWYKELQ